MLVVILMLILSTGITPSTSLSATSMCVSTNAINESQLRLSESGLGGKQQAVQWLPTRGRFEPRPITTSPVSVGFKELMKKFFLPGGSMTSDYYRYTMWRFSQRFVSATCGVFGTQALLMALGVKQRHNLGINAATMWVLKDALGKVSRILWASVCVMYHS
jgi:purine-cytosine permease-like protein